ncbi:hypothetical protein GHT89_16325 [Acinetobacter baumannii]|uniref:hypothetical protein n=1 Tax=Acinetobacter baumannii TaxID=470 RepID=UPI00387DD482
MKNSKNIQKIQDIILANKNYIPVTYEDYKKIDKPLKKYNILLSVGFLILMICLVFITIISYILFFIKSPEITSRIYSSLAVVAPIAFLMAGGLIILSRRNKKLIANNHLIEAGDPSDFEEINLHGYNNIKELCDRDSEFKKKIIEVLDHRSSKVLAFDYHQLNVDVLLMLYDNEKDEQYFSQKKAEIINSIIN